LKPLEIVAVLTLLSLTVVATIPVQAQVATQGPPPTFQIAGVVSQNKPSVFYILFGSDTITAKNVIINPVPQSGLKDYNETHNPQAGWVYFYQPDQYSMEVNITYYYPVSTTIYWVFTGGTQNQNSVSNTFVIFNETSVALKFTLQLAQETIPVTADQLMKIQTDATALGILQGFQKAAELQAVNNEAVTFLAVGFFVVIVVEVLFIIWAVRVLKRVEAREA
jgi:hypothetical protein